MILLKTAAPYLLRSVAKLEYDLGVVACLMPDQ